MPATSRAYSMTMHCRPRQMPRVGTRFSRAQRSAPTLPSMPRTPNPPGTSTASTPPSAFCAPLGLAVVGRDPADAHLGVVVEAARAQRLGDRQVGVGQVDVLADERDLDLVLGLVHALQQHVPARPVDVAERQAEPPDDVRVEPFGVQHLRDVVDARRVLGGHDGLDVDVAHERDLALDRLGDVAVGAQHERVGLDADLRSAATECCVGLVFSSPLGAR